MDEPATKPEPRSKDDPAASGVISSDLRPKMNDSLEVGAIVAGKYLISKLAGTGAFGLVYEAHNVELEEKVAIKRLRPEMLTDAGIVARFAREAKAAAAIKSEHAARVYDVGVTGDGVTYMVMEYLEGKDFAQLLHESGGVGVSPRMAVEYTLQVCEALAVAHSKGIVHRDIKPENLLLVERPGGLRSVKVLDFGISKVALTGKLFNNTPIVKTTNMMGTPLYMSPEQIRSSVTVDVRSDIWSLGMVLYEILAGEPPFGGDSITEICAAILEHEPRKIETLRTDLTPELVNVLMKCLEKDMTKRYQNVAELALALMPFAPKRTRINVERTVTTLQAAGMFDPNHEIASIPPPPSSAELPTIPLAPRTGLESSPISAPLSPAASAPSMPEPTPALKPATVSTSSPPAAEPKRSKAPALIAVALLAVFGIGVLARNAMQKPTATPEPAPTQTQTVATMTAAPPPPPPPATTTAQPTSEPAAAPTPTPTPSPTQAIPTGINRRVLAPAPQSNVPSHVAAKPAASPKPSTPEVPSQSPQPTTTRTGRTFPRDL